jgi:hypothetical protein
MKKLLLSTLLIGALGLMSCAREADIASENISRSADSFEISRRIVFYNGITGDYILTIEGLCSLGNFDAQKELTVTCKTGPNSYKKHFLGLSQNVTFFAEQIQPTSVSIYHYKVIFRPETIVPDVEVR